MKRILFVTTSFENGAIPNVLLDLAPHWRLAGWDCHFLALEPLPETHASVRRCRELGFPLTSLNVGPRSVVRALLRLHRAIGDLHPDLISTHLGRADIYTPWVKGHVPQLTTHHSVRQNAGRLTNWGYRLSDRRVAWRTGVSQACNDSYLEHGFLRSPHSVIPNPVEPARLVPRATRDSFKTGLRGTGEGPLLAAVGRLIPLKNHEALLHALVIVRASGFPQASLVIAGDGPLGASLKARIGTLGLDGAVTLLGSYQPVADVYQAADVLVFPSLWEGMGLVVLEAWCLGCPVAASAIPAVQEFVRDGENGVLFDPHSPETIAEGILRVLRDPEEARRAAQAGKGLVLDRYSPARIAAEYAELFQRLTPGV
jgi:glycosyltransferase involved in cell wall biosynthesis